MRNSHIARWVSVIVCLAGTTCAVTAATLTHGNSIQQLMIQQVDPAADTLWGSVGIEESSKGAEQKAPRTDVQWSQLQLEAQKLVAGAQALQVPHLAVGGKTHGLLADANTPGIRSAAQIRADIDRDPAKFAAAAHRLELAGKDLLIAIAARDPIRLTQGGAAMDAACEACHSAYWYPRKRLTLPSDAEFSRITTHP